MVEFLGGVGLGRGALRERERESEGRDGGREGERAVLGNNILDY